MKKVLILLAILMLTGCSESIGKVNVDEPITYKTNQDFVASDYVDLEEGSSVEYEIDKENSKVVFTITNGDETLVLEHPVVIQEPLAKFNCDDNLIINKNSFKPESILSDIKEGTDITYELTDTSVVLTLTNGDQTDIMEHDATITESIGWFNTDDILIDVPYTIYPIEDVLTLIDGTKIDSYSLSYNTLTVTLVNGDIAETLTKEVKTKPMKVEDHDTKFCKGYPDGSEGHSVLTLYPDGRMDYWTNQSGIYFLDRYDINDIEYVTKITNWETYEYGEYLPECPTGGWAAVEQRIE